MQKTIAILLALTTFVAQAETTDSSPGAQSLSNVEHFLKNLSRPTEFTTSSSNGAPALGTGQRQRECLRDEMQVFDIESSLLRDWRTAWQKKDFAGFDKLSTGTFKSSAPLFPSANGTVRKFNDIQVTQWGQNAKDSTEKRLGQFKEVASLDLNIVDYTTDYNKRNSSSMRFNQVEATVQFDARGFTTKGERREDRGRFRTLLSQNDGAWKIDKIEPISGETLEIHRAPAFQDATKDIGLDGLPIFARTEAIRRGGYALAIADVNSDGRDDLLVGFRDKVALLFKGADGRYTDVTKGSGLETLKYVKTAIFADFMNRGKQDLVVTILSPVAGANTKGETSVLLFRGDGKGHFAEVKMNHARKTAFLQPMPAAVGDFNNDGYLDLYVGYPGIRDFTVLDSRPEAKNVQGLYLNDKKGSFVDFKDGFKMSDYSAANRLYPHAGMAANIDQKGGIDLVVVDDRNNLSPIYMNDGKNQFRQMAKEIGLGNNGYGMSVAIGDYNNDGIADLLWTNVNFFSGQRLSQACTRMWGIEAQFNEDGLRVFRGGGDGKFGETTDVAGLSFASGQGAAGVTFLDYDNDGWMDIYLTNGLWSGTPGAQDLSTVFTALAYHKMQGMSHLLKPEDFINFKAMLANFEGEISSNGTVTPKAGQHPNMLGEQHNRLFHNNGDGTFTDIAFMEGVDVASDGYVVGTEINAQGKPDLILRNGDPGIISHPFPVVQYMRNGLENKLPSVILSLEGTKSNRDAFGAFAIAIYKDHKQSQHLISNSGSAQSQRVLHFGLGQEKMIPELEVHWPSGLVQTLKNVKPGRWHIQENKEPESEGSLLSQAD